MHIRWLLLSITIFGAFLACSDGDARKIKLADVADGESAANARASVVRLAENEQRAIAIVAFHNNSKDHSLNWLCRGLADMLRTELSQSPYLSVFQLAQTGENLVATSDSAASIASELFAAREAQAEILLTGKFSREANQLTIHTEMIDVLSGQVVRRVAVQGESLERIFSMVDELSQKVHGDLRDGTGEFADSRLELADMTRSIEAFRCYSEALANRDKLLFVEAEQCLKDAIAYDSTFAMAYLRMAQIKRSLMDSDEFKYYFGKVKQYSHKLGESDLVFVELLEESFKRDYRAYSHTLKNAVKRNPSNIELRLELAQFYANIGNLNDALMSFETVLAKDPGHANTLNLMGYLFAKRGDFTTALQYIEKYKAARPDEPNPFDSKGEILMRAGRLDEAVEEFNVVMRRWPQFFFTALRLAEIAVEKGDMAEALHYSDYSVEHAPSTQVKLHTKVYRALIYWRFGQPEVAARIFSEVLNAQPTEVYPMMLAAELYKSLGDSLQAERLEQTAFRHFEAKLLNQPPDVELINSFLSFSFSTQSIPPEKLVTLLEHIEPKMAASDIQTLLRFSLGYNYLRAGNRDAAHRLFADHGEALIDLFTMKYNNGWGSGWKYIIETMDYEATVKPENNPFIQRLLEIARSTDRKDLQYLSKLLRARIYEQQENIPAVQKEFRDLGMPMEYQWDLAGPFSGKTESPFNYAFPPEMRQKTQSDHVFNGKAHPWQPANDGFMDGYINLQSQFQPYTWAVAYAWTYVYASEEQKVQIRLGTDETCKLWLNDDLIWQHYLKEDAKLDRDLVTVVLRPGYNKLLLKITNTDFDWGFYLRITGENGDGLPGISFHSPADVHQNLSAN
ncbi:MAG: tetratricopeptide repeat protein [Calditrichia bacterium]